MKGVVCQLKEGATLADLIKTLSGKYPAFRQTLTDGRGVLLPQIRIVAGGLATNKMDLALAPGSEIVFFPAMAGG